MNNTTTITLKLDTDTVRAIATRLNEGAELLSSVGNSLEYLPDLDAGTALIAACHNALPAEIKAGDTVQITATSVATYTVKLVDGQWAAIVSIGAAARRWARTSELVIVKDGDA